MCPRKTQEDVLQNVQSSVSNSRRWNDLGGYQEERRNSGSHTPQGEGLSSSFAQQCGWALTTLCWLKKRASPSPTHSVISCFYKAQKWAKQIKEYKFGMYFHMIFLLRQRTINSQQSGYKRCGIRGTERGAVEAELSYWESLFLGWVVVSWVFIILLNEQRKGAKYESTMTVCHKHPQIWLGQEPLATVSPGQSSITAITGL